MTDIRRIAVVLAIASIMAGLAAVPASAAPSGCGFPGRSWVARRPASVDLDAAKLQDALDFATQHSSATMLVVRRGCLAGATRLDGVTQATMLDGWSMTKSVTAMLVGRAATLGKLDIDRPIAGLFPEADRAHGAITARHLLTMTSGLHVNWLRDLNPAMPDRVRDALSLDIDHRPGRSWAYAQSPVTLLAHLVERAVGRDLQDWAQEQLFGPVGIARSEWTWDRDRADHTEGWAHLKMVSPAWARLGYLLLRDGNWNGRQLISRSYVRRMTTSTPANHAYGFLTWLNGRDSYVLPSVNGRDTGRGWVVPAAPKDTIIFAGNNEQRMYVIPSLDLVVVRLGFNGSRELDMRTSVWTGRGGELDHELMRRVTRAVSDKRIEDPGPYGGSDPVLPSLEPESIPGSARDPEQVAGGAGAGPSAPNGCTPAGCS